LNWLGFDLRPRRSVNASYGPAFSFVIIAAEKTQEFAMRGKKLEDFEKDNPNYKFLIEAINSGNVRLMEDECLALIIPPSSLHLNLV